MCEPFPRLMAFGAHRKSSRWNEQHSGRLTLFGGSPEYVAQLPTSAFGSSFFTMPAADAPIIALANTASTAIENISNR
jgi:hypothetical protein